MSTDYTIHLKRPHARQEEFINHPAKRKVIRAGRRGGKTTGIAIYAVMRFLMRRRVLYATPTQEQIDKFWYEIKLALAEPIDAGLLYKNETRHIIEVPGTTNRIRAKTAWNADTLRGDYADDLILDEFQLMAEDTWGLVGAPMLLDNDGDAVFIYTPPSARSKSMSKAIDKLHAAKLFAKAKADTSGRWATFHFRSHDNPYISATAIGDLTNDMTALAIRQEIEAEDLNEIPGALWKRDQLDALRVEDVPDLKRIVVAVDPAISADEGSNETGIVVVGLGADGHGYVLADRSLVGSPDQWAKAVLAAFYTFEANEIVAEVNQGGDMVESTIKTADDDKQATVHKVRATRGKYTRAEPISALYEQGRVHHVGRFDLLEDQFCTWLPGEDSPDRLDAAVWGLTQLMLGIPAKLEVTKNPFYGG